MGRVLIKRSQSLRVMQLAARFGQKPRRKRKGWLSQDEAQTLESDTIMQQKSADQTGLDQK